MTSKERFLKTINRETPDRPALYLSFVPQLAEKLYAHYDMPYQPALDAFLSNHVSWTDLLDKMGVDCMCFAASSPDNNKTRVEPDGLIVNEWRIGMRNHGLYDDFAVHPLAHAQSVEDIENFPFPRADAPGRFRDAELTVAKYGEKYGIIGDLECSIFELAWYLTGLEKFLMDMMIEEPYVEVLLDKITDYHIAVGKRLIEMGSEMIWCGDDYGTQRGPLFDLDTFDRLFAPRIARMFSAFKEMNPNVKVAWHSCGSILPLIPRFIELGLDVLNPIQPLADGMNPQYLKDNFGDKLIFFGGICIQDLLPNSTPEQIKAEVRRRADILANDGNGWLIAPAHNIQSDTSVENIFAFIEAVHEL